MAVSQPARSRTGARVKRRHVPSVLGEVVEGHPQCKHMAVLIHQAQNPGRGIRAPVQQRAVLAVWLVPAIADKAADEADLRGHHGRAGQRGHSYPAVRVTRLARRSWYLLSELQVVLLHVGSASVSPPAALSAEHSLSQKCTWREIWKAFLANISSAHEQLTACNWEDGRGCS